MKTASRERFGLRHTSDEAFGMSGPCFAEHGFPAGNDLIGVPEVDLLGGLASRCRHGGARHCTSGRNDRQNVLAWP